MSNPHLRAILVDDPPYKFISPATFSEVTRIYQMGNLKNCSSLISHNLHIPWTMWSLIQVGIGQELGTLNPVVTMAFND